MKKGWTVAIAGLGVNLALGVLYSWGVFASALRNEGWSATQSQIPYMAACLVFAILMVPGGSIQDRTGPRPVLLFAAILTFIGFVLSGVFLTIAGLTIFFGVVFGTAMGFGYAATTPAAIKWFGSRKRGMISGVVVSGFGLAGIYVAPMTSSLVERFGLKNTFIVLGLLFSVWIFIFRIFIKDPPEGYTPFEGDELSKVEKSERKDYGWREMVGTFQFAALWSMFFAGTFAGLLILGQLSDIAVEQVGITTMQATTFIMIYAVFNWLGRIATGVISDRIGTKITLFSIFMMQAICFLLFSRFDTVLLLGLGTATAALSFGGMLAIFPAATADYFGVKNLGVNYGLVFTAWGAGGLTGPLLGGLVRDITGTYHTSYIVSALLCFLGAFISLVGLSVARFRTREHSRAADVLEP